MTRKQIRNECAMILHEYSSSDGAREPLLWNRHICRSLDQIQRETWSYYTRRWQNFVIDKATGMPAYEYKSAGCKSIESVYCMNAAGTYVLLQTATPEQMDCAYGSLWRDPQQAQTGSPYIYVSEGPTAFQLYPRPDYTTHCENALAIEGYFVSGFVWDSTLDYTKVHPESPLSEQENAENPLGDGNDEVVILGACLRRLRELPSPEARLRRAEMKIDYRELLGNVAAEAKNQVDAIRHNIGGAGLGSAYIDSVYIGGN